MEMERVSGETKSGEGSWRWVLGGGVCFPGEELGP